MSDVKRYKHAPTPYSLLFINTLPAGVYVLASDYDQLKAENEALMIQSMHRGEQLLTLRKQVDEARELLEMSRTYLMRVGDKESIDAWLEANK